MTALPSKFSGERWVLWRFVVALGQYSPWLVGSASSPYGESVEVMPVSEHVVAIEEHESQWASDFAKLAGELDRLREAAQATFDAAGNGDDTLGAALINLGLVLAGEEPNPHV